MNVKIDTIITTIMFSLLFWLLDLSLLHLCWFCLFRIM